MPTNLGTYGERLFIDTLEEKAIYPKTSKEWFHEAWMHHKELSIELGSLLSVMKLINESNKKSLGPEILRLVQDINIQIRILSKYYKNLEMKELETNPMMGLVKNYISYNDELMKKVTHLISNAKFLYN